MSLAVVSREHNIFFAASGWMRVGEWALDWIKRNSIERQVVATMLALHHLGERAWRYSCGQETWARAHFENQASVTLFWSLI